MPKQALWKIAVPVVLSEESVVEEVVVEGTLDDVDIIDVVVDMLHDVGSWSFSIPQYLDIQLWLVSVRKYE